MSLVTTGGSSGLSRIVVTPAATKLSMLCVLTSEKPTILPTYPIPQELSQ